MSSTCVNAGAAFSLLPEATLLVSLLKEAQNGVRIGDLVLSQPPYLHILL